MITRYRHVVPAEHVDAALRTIWQDLMRRGILPDEIDNYRRLQPHIDRDEKGETFVGLRSPRKRSAAGDLSGGTTTATFMPHQPRSRATCS